MEPVKAEKDVGGGINWAAVLAEWATPPAPPVEADDSRSEIYDPVKEKYVPREPASDNDGMVYLKGWRLRVMSLATALSMFLVNMEVAVIGTSLIAIVNDLQGFAQMGWVVTGYLITYTGTLIIWAKLSDIFGRKVVMLTSMGIFTAFSAGCGAAQSMDQLIIFRVFQGIGAAGSVSLALSVAYEMVPKEKHPLQAMQLAAAIAMGSLVGPVLGGGVSQASSSTWRFVFLINVPAGIVTLLLMFVSIPKTFPYQAGDPRFLTWSQAISRSSLFRLDVFGAFFLLAATLLLVSVLLEVPNEFEWDSPTTIALLATSGVLWAFFFINERLVTTDRFRPEPIFPWRFFSNRLWLGTLLISFLSGIPYNIIIIDIPQRFQLVDNLSPLQSGIRLIPFNFSISFGSVLVNVFAKAGILPLYLLLGGSLLQLAGLLLFTTVPTTGDVPNSFFAFEVITGLGLGFVMGISLLLPPRVVEKRDLPISSGALLQMRVFGGAIGLAVASSVMNSHLTDTLTSQIGAANTIQLQNSIETIALLSPGQQAQVISAFGSGYRLQFQIMVGFAVAQVFAVNLLHKRDPLRVVEKKLPKDLSQQSKAAEAVIGRVISAPIMDERVWKGTNKAFEDSSKSKENKFSGRVISWPGMNKAAAMQPDTKPE